MSDEMMTDVGGDYFYICYCSRYNFYWAYNRLMSLAFLRSYSSCIPTVLILALGTVLKTPDFIIDMWIRIIISI